jgi:hypothetical protein
MFINMPEGIIKELKEKYPQGTKVKLNYMDDKQAPPVGTLGTVRTVDDAGTIHVNWDNGSSLGVIYGEDSITKVE